jgi:hypothetical protein
MPYIKISDPNIIDLAAWQQVINVVNQHSDTLTAITNNFGVQGTGVVDFNDPADFKIQYDPGSQKIIYGRTKIDTNTAPSVPDGTGHVFYGTITYNSGESGTTVFGANPVITATARFGSTESPPSITDANVVVTVISVTNMQFTYRVTDARSTNDNPIPLTGYFYINWVAIGPK